MFLLAAFIFFLGKRLNALPVNKILKNTFAYLCGAERRGVHVLQHTCGGQRIT